MNKKVKKLVPELRFSEFEGDWEKSSIEKIAFVSSGGTPSRTKPAYWNGDIPWVTTSEIGNSEIFNSTEKITKKGLENSSAKIFKKSTILMAMYGQGKTRGQVSILRIDATTNQACAAITLKNNDSPEFIYYFLFKEYERLRTLSNDGSQKNLSAGLIKQYKIPLTSVEEQKKIVSFLDSVALRITQLRRKHELLETYKKGVMQKIFSQQIRFKQDDGKPFPDWEQKKLGDLIKIKSGYAFSSIFFSNKETDKILLTPGNFHVNGGLYFGLNTKYYDGKVEKEFILSNGDLLIVMTDLTKEMNILGNAILLESNKIVLHNQRIGKILIKEDSLTTKKFLKTILNSDICKKEIRKRSTGSTVRHTSNKTILSIKLSIPLIKEQEKIANFLTSIDKKIDAVALQIEKLEEFKKGLLQKMFV